MTLDHLRASAVPFGLRLAVAFRGVRERFGLLIPGPLGWGEFAPFDDYDDNAAGRWLASALEAGHEPWPEPVRDAIPVNAIIPALDPDQVTAMVRFALDELGCTTLKIKVGDDGDADRLAAVRALLPEHGRIRLDVNAQWTVEQTVRFWEQHGGTDIDYVEQPVKTVEELAAIRTRSDVPIALDEMIRWHPDLAGEELRTLGDVAIVKVAPLGGVRAALDVAARIGLPVVVSGSLDSSIGLDAAVACAAALPQLGGPCGLGTGVLLRDDLVAPTLLPRDGRIDVARRDPDVALLAAARARVDADVAAHLFDALTRAWWSEPAEPWRERIGKDA